MIEVSHICVMGITYKFIQYSDSGNSRLFQCLIDVAWHGHYTFFWGMSMSYQNLTYVQGQCSSFSV